MCIRDRTQVADLKDITYFCNKRVKIDAEHEVVTVTHQLVLQCGQSFERSCVFVVDFKTYLRDLIPKFFKAVDYIRFYNAAVAVTQYTVSYTHLDVYKRQGIPGSGCQASA